MTGWDEGILYLRKALQANRARIALSPIFDGRIIDMCCFSEPVEDVSGTKIFARLENGRQVLVYQMMFSSKEDLAMILPIPVTPEAEEGAVEFISLEHFPGFFTLLNLLFASVDDSELEGDTL